jgi:D-serine deaminase-like pyridoxal phosphate-dependent protein
MRAASARDRGQPADRDPGHHRCRLEEPVERPGRPVGDGFGLILEYPDAIIERLNEEHGILDLSHSARKPAIGERVRIVPNHVCVVTNLHDAVVTSRNGLVEATLPVAARGRTR